MSAEIVSLAVRRRQKQEDRVNTTLGLTAQERLLAQPLVSIDEYDQFIFNDALIDYNAILTKDDTFPSHPWTGD